MIALCLAFLTCISSYAQPFPVQSAVTSSNIINAGGVTRTYLTATNVGGNSPVFIYPTIVISPIGLSNGCSVANNGAQFGPDTAGTKTCGIQEAFNSVYQGTNYYNGVMWAADFVLQKGQFNVSTTMVFNAYNCFDFSLGSDSTGYGATIVDVNGNPGKNLLTITATNTFAITNVIGKQIFKPLSIFLHNFQETSMIDTNETLLDVECIYGNFRMENVNLYQWWTAVNFGNQISIQQPNAGTNLQYLVGLVINTNANFTAGQEHSTVLENCFFTGLAAPTLISCDHLIAIGCKSTYCGRCLIGSTVTITNGYSWPDPRSLGALFVRQNYGLDGTFIGCQDWASGCFGYWHNTSSNDKLIDCEFEGQRVNAAAIICDLNSIPPVLDGCVSLDAAPATAQQVFYTGANGFQFNTNYVNPFGWSISMTGRTNGMQIWNGNNCVLSFPYYPNTNIIFANGFIGYSNQLSGNNYNGFSYWNPTLRYTNSVPAASIGAYTNSAGAIWFDDPNYGGYIATYTTNFAGVNLDFDAYNDNITSAWSPNTAGQVAGTVIFNPGQSLANVNGVQGGNFNGSGSGLANVSIIASAKVDGAITSTNNFTYSVPAGVTNRYEIGGHLNVTAVSADVVQTRVSFTDRNNTTQTFFLMSAGVSTTGFNPIPTQEIEARGGTLITMTNVLTTGIGSITYDAVGFLRLVNSR